MSTTADARFNAFWIWNCFCDCCCPFFVNASFNAPSAANDSLNCLSLKSCVACFAADISASDFLVSSTCLSKYFFVISASFFFRSSCTASSSCGFPVANSWSFSAAKTASFISFSKAVLWSFWRSWYCSSTRSSSFCLASSSFSFFSSSLSFASLAYLSVRIFNSVACVVFSLAKSSALFFPFSYVFNSSACFSCNNKISLSLSAIKERWTSTMCSSIARMSSANFLLAASASLFLFADAAFDAAILSSSFSVLTSAFAAIPAFHISSLFDCIETFWLYKDCFSSNNFSSKDLLPRLCASAISLFTCLALSLFRCCSTPNSSVRALYSLNASFWSNCLLYSSFLPARILSSNACASLCIFIRRISVSLIAVNCCCCASKNFTLSSSRTAISIATSACLCLLASIASSVCNIWAAPAPKDFWSASWRVKDCSCDFSASACLLRLSSIPFFPLTKSLNSFQYAMIPTIAPIKRKIGLAKIVFPNVLNPWTPAAIIALSEPVIDEMFTRERFALNVPIDCVNPSKSKLLNCWPIMPNVLLIPSIAGPVFPFTASAASFMRSFNSPIFWDNWLNFSVPGSYWSCCFFKSAYCDFKVFNPFAAPSAAASVLLRTSAPLLFILKSIVFAILE